VYIYQRKKKWKKKKTASKSYKNKTKTQTHTRGANKSEGCARSELQRGVVAEHANVARDRQLCSRDHCRAGDGERLDSEFCARAGRQLRSAAAEVEMHRGDERSRPGIKLSAVADPQRVEREGHPGSEDRGARRALGTTDRQMRANVGGG
jgi:hypothetical protein